MKIKTKTGFVGGGLLSVLGLSFFGLSISMGVLKLNTNALKTENVQNTEFSEEVLKRTVQNLLSQSYCRNNLKPEDDLDDIETIGVENGPVVIQTGEPFKDGLIQIVSMSLKPLSTDERKFYLYYSKPGLEANQTRNGQECKSTDLSGCYYLSCRISYPCPGGVCNSNNDLSRCEVIGECVLGEQQERKSCAQDQILRGTLPDVCVSLPSKGLKDISNTNQNSIMGITGFSDSDNNGVIEATQKNIVIPCPPGKYSVMKEDGSTVCQILCTGGSTLDTETNLCECPAGELFSAGRCQSNCAGGSILNTETNLCECPPGQNRFYYNEQCNYCPSLAPYLWTQYMQCNKCPPERPYLVGTTCKPCPNDRPHFRYEQRYCQTCHRCYRCPRGQHYYGGRCNKCPSNKPYLVGTTCKRCPSNKPYLVGTTCKRCASGQPHWYNSTCNYCPQTCRGSWVYSFNYPQRRVFESSCQWHYCNGHCRRCPCENYYAGRCNKCPKSRPAWGGNSCYPCRGGYYNQVAYNNCACNNSDHFWSGTENRCKPCIGTVTSRWGCEQYICNSPYKAKKQGSKWTCCPKNGPCCKSGNTFRNGRCYDSRGYSCQEGYFVSNDLRSCCRLGENWFANCRE